MEDIQKNPILFVGAGPGDPELITVKGMKALEEADLVIYAGSLVPEKVLEWSRPESEKINSAFLNLEEIVNGMANAYEEGKKVVRLHTGDPSLFGAIREQIDELKKREIPFEVIPGITAAFAAAAVMGLEFTIPEVSQTIIFTRAAGRTPVPDDESLEKLASHRTSMAIYLSVSMIEDISLILGKYYGGKAPVIVAYRVSQPEQKIIETTVDNMAGMVEAENIKDHAIIIVGRFLDVTEGYGKKSRLYDKNFSHKYRKK